MGRIQNNQLENESEQIEKFQSQASPKLIQVKSENTKRLELEPVAVHRLGGTLPWDTESTQLQCGETVTSANGDMNIRLVMGCIVTQSQFEKLSRMRERPEEIKLVSRGYTGPVTFDELKFDRIEDSNGAYIAGQGRSNEPQYDITLQTKESQ